MRHSQSPQPSNENADRLADTSVLDDLRRELCAGLPRALKDALAAYRHFSEGQPPASAKAFTAYQQACRAALAHIQVLLNLATLAAPALDRPDSSDNDDDLYALIEAAKVAVSDGDGDDV